MAMAIWASWAGFKIAFLYPYPGNKPQWTVCSINNVVTTKTKYFYNKQYGRVDTHLGMDHIDLELAGSPFQHVYGDVYEDAVD